MGDYRDEEDPTKMPQATAQEWGLVVAKSLASLIPFAGGPAAEVIGAIITPQIEKRNIEWLEGIARGLLELQQQFSEVTPERLSLHPAFTTAFLHASQIALRTHQPEKHEALRNAVLNVAACTAPDDDLQVVFLNFVDQLVPWHLRVLAYLDGPAAWMERHNVPLTPNRTLDGVTLVDYAFPTLDVRNSSSAVYLDQLATQGLLRADWNEQKNYSSPGTSGGSRTSDLGKQFLAFITTPIPELDNADLNEQKE
jgi:hypothetical protein